MTNDEEPRIEEPLAEVDPPLPTSEPELEHELEPGLEPELEPIDNLPPLLPYIQAEIPAFKTLVPTAESPLLLAIDTCTARSSIALRDAHTLRAESSWESDRHHTAAVSAEIHRLMQSSNITPDQLGAVAVATGPGSFTGVRCGLAIAKGIATARALPLIGMNAFDIVAAAQPNHGMPMFVLIEIGRARVAVRRYLWQNNRAVAAGDWGIQTWQEFSSSVEPPAWVCGDVSPKLMALLETRAVLAPSALNLRRAGFLAEIAYARWRAADTDNPLTLTPIYPPEKVS